MNKKKIVIIGGGFVGTLCAKKLEKDFDVILIDDKSYFEYTPAILRTILEPGHAKKIQVLHSQYLKRAKIITNRVLEVSKKEVTLEEKKQKIPFNYLIIASGSNYATPIKEEGLIPAYRAEELALYHDRLMEAKRILVIGGGLVGVELTAEISTHCKDKDITIVHSHDELIERNHPKARKYAREFLEKHGIKILFGERVKDSKNHTFVTDKGTKIKSDMSFISVGIMPNYEFMKKNFSNFLNERNLIKTNSYLQLAGFSNIFVGGDITSIKEEKTAQTSKKHAALIVKNIYNLENNRPLEEYISKRRPMVISLGKYNGIFEYKNIVITGFIPAFLKWAIEKSTMWKYR